jgi:hypothetical protein
MVYASIMITNDIEIDGVTVNLDREATLNLMITVSGMHGRLCTRIAKSSDMDEASRVSPLLPPLSNLHARLERALTHFEDGE